MSQIPFEVGLMTDPGRKRRLNEDSVGGPEQVPLELLQQRGWLFVVSDGMGGEAGGKHASQRTIQVLIETYYRNPGADIRTNLLAAVQAANAAVRADARANPVLARMGATVTAAVVHGAELHVAHVGDSRAYLVRSGVATQLTEDHTWVQEQLRNRTLTPAEAQNHPQSHVLTRAIGAKDSVDAYYTGYQLAAGDRVLLCSDGLSNMLTEIEIAAHVTQAPCQRAADNLVAEANRRGGPDNISAVILGMPSAALVPAPGPEAAPTQQELNLPAGGGRRLSNRSLTMIGVGAAAALSVVALIFLLNEGVDKPLNAANARGTADAAAVALQAAANNSTATAAVATATAAQATVVAIQTVEKRQTESAGTDTAEAANEAALATSARNTALAMQRNATPTPPRRPQPGQTPPTPVPSGPEIVLQAPGNGQSVKCMVQFSWLVGEPYASRRDITYRLRICEQASDPACAAPKIAKEESGFWTVFDPGKKAEYEALGLTGAHGTYIWFVDAVGAAQVPRPSARQTFVWSGDGCGGEPDGGGGGGGGKSPTVEAGE